MTTEKVQDPEIMATFLKAEQLGLKLAHKGRFAAIGLMAAWLAVSRGPDRAAEFLIVAALFVALGLTHFLMISTRWDKPWVKYVFLGLDVAALSLMVAVVPVIPGQDLPQSFIFRFDIFPYYFLFIAVAGFSFSPGLVLWAGIAGGIGWISAFLHIRSNAPDAVAWGEIPADPTYEQFIAVFLSPDFLSGGSRAQEVIVLMIVATLLAVVMKRTRNTVYAHLEADAERRSVSDMFGRYVPKAVADAMISDRGALEPIERESTVLFADIEGFTTLTEELGPGRITAVLNAYFDDATEIIGRHGGVITQFQGDAILAIFNVPVADAAHARHALDAARELLKWVQGRDYHGRNLNIRIGINTGTLVAGNVGGGGRQTYTVHGDAVNTAARLEAMNKDLGTRLLISQSTADQLGGAGLREMGELDIRGLRARVSVFTLD